MVLNEFERLFILQHLNELRDHGSQMKSFSLLLLLIYGKIYLCNLTRDDLGHLENKILINSTLRNSFRIYVCFSMYRN